MYSWEASSQLYLFLGTSHPEECRVLVVTDEVAWLIGLLVAGHTGGLWLSGWSERDAAWHSVTWEVWGPPRYLNVMILTVELASFGCSSHSRCCQHQFECQNSWWHHEWLYLQHMTICVMACPYFTNRFCHLLFFQVEISIMCAWVAKWFNIAVIFGAFVQL